MGNCVLPEEKLLEFSTQAHELRFSDDANLVIDPQNLLIPRRREDIKRDLFSVFNVVQENLIKGGALSPNPVRHSPYGLKVQLV